MNRGCCYFLFVFSGGFSFSLGAPQNARARQIVSKALVEHMPRMVVGIPFKKSDIDIIMEGAASRREDKKVLSTVDDWLVVHDPSRFQLMGYVGPKDLDEDEVAVAVVQFIKKGELQCFWQEALTATAAHVYIDLHVSMLTNALYVWIDYLAIYSSSKQPFHDKVAHLWLQPRNAKCRAFNPLLSSEWNHANKSVSSEIFS